MLRTVFECSVCGKITALARLLLDAVFYGLGFIGGWAVCNRKNGG
jgi:hypothetical protein